MSWAASRAGSGGLRGGLRVAVVDYGAGNLVSIEQGLTFVGADVRIARTPGDLEGAEAVIVPGVGAAAPAMRRLARAGLVDPLLRWIALGKPYLGICLGLQLLFDGSDEPEGAWARLLRLLCRQRREVLRLALASGLYPGRTACRV